MIALKQLLLISTMLVLTACSSSSKQTESSSKIGFAVDIPESEKVQFNKDVHECWLIAQKFSTPPSSNSSLGDVADSALGSVASVTENTPILAGVLGAYLPDTTTQDVASITKNCLIGRGYNILN